MFFTSAMLLVAAASCIATVWFIFNHFFPFQFNSFFQPKTAIEEPLKLPREKVRAFQDWLNHDLLSSYLEKKDQTNDWIARELQKARSATDKNVKNMEDSMHKKLDRSIDYIKDKADEIKGKVNEQIHSPENEKLQQKILEKFKQRNANENNN